MAGLYSDLPGIVVPYHVNGYVALQRGTSSTVPGGGTIYRDWEPIPPTDLDKMVDFNPATYANRPGNSSVDGLTSYPVLWWSIAFPQPLNLVAYVLFWRSTATGAWATGDTANRRLYTSTDTTDGIDGTWTDHGIWNGFSGTSEVANPSASAMRSSWSTFPLTGVRGFRFATRRGSNVDYPWYTNLLALYVDKFVPTTDDVVFWHPTLDEMIDPNHFDFGDVQQGATADKTFRIKNCSAAATASTINISVSNNTDAGSITLSDGGAFGATVQIATLAPGVISSVITARKSVDGGDPIGVASADIRVSAGAWA